MKIYKGWYEGETGKTYAVKITADTGRILATAKVEVPLQPGYGLEERIGEAAVRGIEDSVLSAASEVARGVQTPPQPANHT